MNPRDSRRIPAQFPLSRSMQQLLLSGNRGNNFLLGRKGEIEMALATATAGVNSVETGSTGLNRWWRVIGGLMMNIALGTLYAWSVFVAPLEKEFGWKRAQTSNVFTIAVVVFAIAFIFAGRLQDKLGPFKISMVGCILLTIGFLLSATTTSLP